MNYNVTTSVFEWDDTKNNTNRQKHGISFELSATVFDDPLQISLIDPDEHREERWITFGRASNQDVLTVIHTYHQQPDENEIIRIISARRATKKEREEYAEGI